MSSRIKQDEIVEILQRGLGKGLTIRTLFRKGLPWEEARFYYGQQLESMLQGDRYQLKMYCETVD